MGLEHRFRRNDPVRDDTRDRGLQFARAIGKGKQRGDALVGHLILR